MRQVLLYQDEDGTWIAEVPSLPGCHSDGETRDEALMNVQEAIVLWIEDAEAHGEPIPDDSLTDGRNRTHAETARGDLLNVVFTLRTS